MTGGGGKHAAKQACIDSNSRARASTTRVRDGAGIEKGRREEGCETKAASVICFPPKALALVHSSVLAL